MADRAAVANRAEAMRVIGDLVEAAEPIYGQGGEAVEYAVPAENYEALLGLWSALQEREIL